MNVVSCVALFAWMILKFPLFVGGVGEGGERRYSFVFGLVYIRVRGNIRNKR